VTKGKSTIKLVHRKEGWSPEAPEAMVLQNIIAPVRETIH